MAGNSKIVAIEPETQVPDPVRGTVDEPRSVDDAVDVPWDYEEPKVPSRWRNLVWPVLAVLTISAWTGFFVWTYRATMLAPAAPSMWAGWIRDWSLPVILVCCLWLIVQRNSRKEAERFGATARLLSDESGRLEQRLSTVNSELSLAREFIGAQTRDLDALGRMAADRISDHANRLSALVAENGTRIETIGAVSEAALDNMEKLRGQLPVIASAAKDVTNNIGNAGRTAHTQLEDMISGFSRLNEFGQASEKQVARLREMVAGTMAEFALQSDKLGEIAVARFAALTDRGDEFRAELDSREVEALAAIRTRATALADEMASARETLDVQEAQSLASLRARLVSIRDESAAIGRSVRDGESTALEAWKSATATLEEDLRSAIARVAEVDERAIASARSRLGELTSEADAVDQRFVERDRSYAEEVERRQSESNARHTQHLEAIAAQLAELDAGIAERFREREAQSEQLVAHAAELDRQLEAFNARMTEIVRHGEDANSGVTAGLSALSDKLIASRDALAGTDTAIAALTDGSVRLLELIQGSLKHSAEDLPLALGQTESRLGQVEARAIALRDIANEAESSGARLSDYVIQSGDKLAATASSLIDLQDQVAERSEAQARQFEDLHVALKALDGDNQAIAERAETTLKASIEALSTSARDAVAGIEQMSAASIATLAERLGDESGAAIERVLRARTAEAAGQLEDAANLAAATGRDTAMQLRDQLAKVNELAGNLERRVAQARERAEEQVDNDFARRVALITEALNSNAIDIARVLETDVTDTAWASYLKGDRGIFTRRAVRLLDTGEAKAVMQAYQNDPSFRDHVSRYIHDFEAMLRQLLSTRDGHALGVTLLSSDMGKLYVALAQAIERLRN